MSERTFEHELPEWTFRGGYFRSSFSTNDIPTAWLRKKGKWKRDELVPYGKASESYRKQFYLCPECDKESLLPSELEYTFVCDSCRMEFGWSFGGLFEKDNSERYAPDDFRQTRRPVPIEDITETLSRQPSAIRSQLEKQELK